MMEKKKERKERKERMGKDQYEGRYYTPDCFAAEALKRVEAALGPDWRDKYAVWDCACGEKALTKQVTFSELYCSTLEQYELDNSAKYNKEATCFVFDFLNDPLPEPDALWSEEGDCLLPEGLKDELLTGRKPLLFLINPPYATSGCYSNDEQAKTGVAKTRTNEAMKAEGYGGSASNLFAQFLYRIGWIRRTYDLDVTVAMLTPGMFLTGPKFRSFRQKWFDQFHMIGDGFMLSAGEFAGAADAWSVCFSMWQVGSQPEEERGEFEFDYTHSQGDKVVVDGKFWLWNTDSTVPASDWVREPIRGLNTSDAPQMSCGCNVKQDGRGRMVLTGRGCVGYMHNDSNKPITNDKGVGLYTSAYSDGNALSITCDTVGYMHNDSNNPNKND